MRSTQSRIQNFVRWAMIVVFVHFSFVNQTPARTVTLTEARNLRDVQDSASNGTPLQLVGRLAAGTEIEIPDDYCVFNESGLFDFDASVRKWTAAMQDKAGKKPVFAKFNEKQRDYFIPITVSKPAAGSKYKDDGAFKTDFPKDQTFYISVRNVVVDTDKAMKTTAATDTYAKAKNTAATKMEAGIRDDCPTCHRDDSGLSQLQKSVTDLKTTTQAALPKRGPSLCISSHASDREILNTFSSIDQNMKKTCGFGLQEFLPEIQKQVQSTSFTPSEIVALIYKESSGVCFANDPGTKGDLMVHGLFGITNSDKQIAHAEGFCSTQSSGPAIVAAAKSDSAFARLSAYTTNPQVHCVGNPFLNLQASIRNLNEKLATFKNQSNLFDSEGKLTDAGFQQVVQRYGPGTSSYGKSVACKAQSLKGVVNEVLAMNNSRDNAG